MKKSTLLLLLTLLLLSCHDAPESSRAYRLQGAWILRHELSPIGLEWHYSTAGSGTDCIIYEGDSLLYLCQLSRTPTGLVFIPFSQAVVTIVDKGRGELLYLENDDPRPLRILNDSTIDIQRSGTHYQYVRDDAIYQEWGSEMCQIIVSELQNGTAPSQRYVLSAKERQQERTIQWFVFLLAFILIVALAAAHLAIANRRARRQLQLQLQQIQEVQENRPQEVRLAVASVESTYFASDEYAALQKRVASGERLAEPDWAELERQLKAVYPGFTSQLRSLYPMSELEYQTCLLIKLRIAPKDIAMVLARDVSTISTVRSRLYGKVFGKKGGSKDWDDFILSMAK